jgi:hypothetical protein
MPSSSPSTDNVALLRLLVMSSDISRVVATRHAACGWPAHVDVEWTCTWHEAVRRARELPAHLVIVDCSSGLTEGAALARHLKRHHPELDVLAFADVADTDVKRPGQPSIAWPWPALAMVLDEWLDLHLELRDASARPGASA